MRKKGGMLHVYLKITNRVVACSENLIIAVGEKWSANIFDDSFQSLSRNQETWKISWILIYWWKRRAIWQIHSFFMQSDLDMMSS